MNARRHILLSGPRDLDQLEIAAGRLYLIRKGRVGELSELSLLYSKIAAKAASLADD
jgi:hypothetical protein